MSDTAVRPRKAKGDAELRAMLRQWKRDALLAEKEAREEAQRKAERRARKPKPQGKPAKRADAGERHVSSPAKGSHLWRYYVSGVLDTQQWSAGVEYGDLASRVSDAKVSSYGQLPTGGGDGALSDSAYIAITRLRAADARLERIGPLCRAVVHAVCASDWSTSGFLRDIGRRPAEGINLLRDGLAELARMWRLPERRNPRA